MFGAGSRVFSAVYRAQVVDFADGFALGVKSKPAADIRKFTAGAASQTLTTAGF